MKKICRIYLHFHVLLCIKSKQLPVLIFKYSMYILLHVQCTDMCTDIHFVCMYKFDYFVLMLCCFCTCNDWDFLVIVHVYIWYPYGICYMYMYMYVQSLSWFHQKIFVYGCLHFCNMCMYQTTNILIPMGC